MFVQNTSNGIIHGLVCTLLDTPISADLIKSLASITCAQKFYGLP